MKKILSTILVFMFVFMETLLVYPISVFAQKANEKPRQMSTTILPEGNAITHEECIEMLVNLDKEQDPVTIFKEKSAIDRETILSCGIRTGRIHFWMIPYYIVYIIEFLIGISGLIAILFIVIGGYQLVISGATDQKDNAKNTIKHALMGLALVLIAWIVVNVIQYVVTI